MDKVQFFESIELFLLYVSGQLVLSDTPMATLEEQVGRRSVGS